MLRQNQNQQILKKIPPPTIFPAQSSRDPSFGFLPSTDDFTGTHSSPKRTSNHRQSVSCHGPPSLTFPPPYAAIISFMYPALLVTPSSSSSTSSISPPATAGAGGPPPILAPSAAAGAAAPPPLPPLLPRLDDSGIFVGGESACVRGGVDRE